MALNVGGNATSYNGIQYQADAYFTGGMTHTRTGEISGTNGDAVYNSERYDDSSYSIPVSNGTYAIDFNFSETYHENAGERIFNVVVEGSTELPNVDIYKAVGLNAAYGHRHIQNVQYDDPRRQR